jgi:hypothetical protein
MRKQHDEVAAIEQDMITFQVLPIHLRHAQVGKIIQNLHYNPVAGGTGLPSQPSSLIELVAGAAVSLPRGDAFASAHIFQSRLTCIGAAIARVGADPAVLVLSGMAFAFFTASPTCLCTGLDRSPQNLDVGSCTPGRHRSRCSADVGAIEVQPDALPEFVDHLFRQAGVGAGRAGLRTVIRLFDELQEPIGRVTLNVRVGAHHLANVHNASSWLVRRYLGGVDGFQPGDRVGVPLLHSI